MLTEKQILALNEFCKVNESFIQGDAWCYDRKKKIMYSPVTENKLNKLFENLPKYLCYKIITLSNIKKMEV
jgi:uncharacterized protein YktA (UPF0223 family)